MKTPRITRLRIRHFAGIELLDHVVPPGGLIARGKNSAGKTSVLSALRAALAGRGIDETAIRNGHEKAEILVDLDSLVVRRLITRDGPSKLSIENKDTFDKKAKPQAFLSELLGTAAIDPLDLFLADKKKRREIVLGALPVKLTSADVARWLSEGTRAMLPPGFVDRVTKLHGLEACAELHALLYARRTQANAEVKRLTAAIEVQEADARAHADGQPIPTTLAEAAERLTLAERAAREAVAALGGIEDRARQAEAFTGRTTKTRETIATKRAEAEKTSDRERDVETFAAESARLLAELRATQDKIAETERLLVTLRALESSTAETHRGAVTCEREAREKLLAAKRAGEEADALQASLGAAAAVAPTPDELAAAKNAVTESSRVMLGARRCLIAAETMAAVAAKRLELDDVAKEASALNDAVVVLAKQAPAELLAASDGIPGLGVDGDVISLDGVALDSLCGAEQMHFAVDVARRANAKSKILIVDGLERLDEGQCAAFIARATAGNYQLICSRVDKGDLTLEAIEPADDVADTVPAPTLSEAP